MADMNAQQRRIGILLHRRTTFQSTQDREATQYILATSQDLTKILLDRDNTQDWNRLEELGWKKGNAYYEGHTPPVCLCYDAVNPYKLTHMSSHDMTMSVSLFVLENCKPIILQRIIAMEWFTIWSAHFWVRELEEVCNKRNGITPDEMRKLFLILTMPQSVLELTNASDYDRFEFTKCMFQLVGWCMSSSGTPCIVVDMWCEFLRNNPLYMNYTNFDPDTCYWALRLSEYRNGICRHCMEKLTECVKSNGAYCSLILRGMCDILYGYQWPNWSRQSGQESSKNPCPDRLKNPSCFEWMNDTAAVLATGIVRSFSALDPKKVLPVRLAAKCIVSGCCGALGVFDQYPIQVPLWANTRSYIIDNFMPDGLKEKREFFKFVVAMTGTKLTINNDASKIGWYNFTEMIRDDPNGEYTRVTHDDLMLTVGRHNELFDIVVKPAYDGIPGRQIGQDNPTYTTALIRAFANMNGKKNATWKNYNRALEIVEYLVKHLVPDDALLADSKLLLRAFSRDTPNRGLYRMVRKRVVAIYRAILCNSTSYPDASLSYIQAGKVLEAYLHMLSFSV